MVLQQSMRSTRNAGKQRDTSDRTFRFSSEPNRVLKRGDRIPYLVFGKLTDRAIMQPLPGHTLELVRWLAHNRDKISPEELRDAVETEHPNWFRSRASFNLFDRSLRLPQGELIMSVKRNPKILRGDPPPRVIARWNQAQVRYPNATFFLMQPYFDRPNCADAKALTRSSLQEMVDRQWKQLFSMADRWGWFLNWKKGEGDRGQTKRASDLLLFAYAQREQYLELVATLNQLLQNREIRLSEALSRLRSKKLSAAVEMGFVPPTSERMLTGRASDNAAPATTDAGPLRRRHEEFIAEIAMKRVAGMGTNVGGNKLLQLIHMEQLFRYDPVLVARIPGDNSERLIAHWDEYPIEVDGRKQMRKLLHI